MDKCGGQVDRRFGFGLGHDNRRRRFWTPVPVALGTMQQPEHPNDVLHGVHTYGRLNTVSHFDGLSLMAWMTLPSVPSLSSGTTTGRVTHSTALTASP